MLCSYTIERSSQPSICVCTSNGWKGTSRRKRVTVLPTRKTRRSRCITVARHLRDKLPACQLAVREVRRVVHVAKAVDIEQPAASLTCGTEKPAPGTREPARLFK